MRLLVLDESQVLPWVVKHLAPPDTEVLGVTDFAAAQRQLREDPPDAAIVSISPAQLPWRDFQHLCATRQPPVPVLYESCLHASPEEAGLAPVEGYAAFLHKPSPNFDLKAEIDRLLATALDLWHRTAT